MRNGVKIVSVDTEGAGQRVDNYLLRRLPGVPKSHVYKLLRSGQVRVDGGRVKPHRKLRADEKVRIPPVRVAERGDAPRPPDELIARLRAAVVHEDADYLIVDKPAGQAVHGGSGVSFGLIEALRQARGGEQRLELCHRLDRDTSGLLLIARTRAALMRAQQAFRSGTAVKRYLCLLVGRRDAQIRVDAPLATQRVQGGERRTLVAADGRHARSDFTPIETFEAATLVRVRLHTGRMHQIRAHALHLGQPVIGDDKYGQRGDNQRFAEAGLRRMYLHAESLALPADGEFAAIRADTGVPDDFRAACERLRGAAP